MTNSEIDEKIAKLQKAIGSPATPENQKESFRGIIKKLEAAKTKEPTAETPVPANIPSDKKSTPKRVKSSSDDVKAKKVPQKYKVGDKVYVTSLKKSGTVDSVKFEDELKQHKYVIKFSDNKKESVYEPDLKTPEKEKPTVKKSPVSTEPKKDPYNCEDLIAEEKARKRKQKEQAEARAEAPKHTPATKNKLAIEKVGDRVIGNLKKRIEKGEVKRPELERLIKTTEDVLSELKAQLKSL